MSDSESKLREVAKEIKSKEIPDQITVRELLRWFGAQRRGVWITQQIRESLDRHSLTTTPDFEGAYIDGLISFEQKATGKGKPEQPVDTGSQTEPPIDPTYRIGRLPSANQKLTSVSPDDSIQRAITLMLVHDFSQLPVMTSDYNVKGVISWSSLGRILALGKKCEFVRECMEPHKEIKADESIFFAIDTIVSNEYVLIRNNSNAISGIVTTSDLSVQFKQLGEPFLLIGEIENYIRRVIDGKFDGTELNTAKDSADSEREILSVSDLTFGEYVRLLENDDRWKKIDLSVDRKEFINLLNSVRRIRNDVMHFDPDGIPDSDLKILRDCVKFFRGLAAIKAI